MNDRQDKHTQGPWHIHRWYGAEGCTDEALHAEDEGVTVEEFRDNTEIKGIRGSNGESVAVCHDLATITPANARLLSAAPTLLAFTRCEAARAKAAAVGEYAYNPMPVYLEHGYSGQESVGLFIARLRNEALDIVEGEG